jgi:hypothetical protein
MENWMHPFSRALTGQYRFLPVVKEQRKRERKGDAIRNKWIYPEMPHAILFRLPVSPEEEYYGRDKNIDK